MPSSVNSWLHCPSRGGTPRIPTAAQIEVRRRTHCRLRIMRIASRPSDNDPLPLFLNFSFEFVPGLASRLGHDEAGQLTQEPQGRVVLVPDTKIAEHQGALQALVGLEPRGYLPRRSKLRYVAEHIAACGSCASPRGLWSLRIPKARDTVNQLRSRRGGWSWCLKRLIARSFQRVGQHTRLHALFGHPTWPRQEKLDRGDLRAASTKLAIHREVQASIPGALTRGINGL
jgi:hypothetical protein